MKNTIYKNAILATMTNAPTEKVNKLKRTLKLLRDQDATQEDFIQWISEYSRQFTRIGSDVCEWIITDVNAYLDGFEAAHRSAEIPQF
jgi:hypothetical protein